MDKLIKLTAVAFFVCSGVTGSAIADTSSNNMNSNSELKQPSHLLQPPNNVNQQGSMPTHTSAPNDNKLNSDVNAALAEYAGKVKITVRNAVVYLTGELASDTDYDKVVTFAESTKGVSDVNVDKLTVKGSSQPLQDAYITAKVKGTLIREDLMGKDVPSWSVHVETKNGMVFLSGTVSSQDQKQNILKVVKSIKGVTTVNDKTELATSNDATPSTSDAILKSDTTTGGANNTDATAPNATDTSDDEPDADSAGTESTDQSDDSES